MLIIGGRNSLWGAVTGSLLISFLAEVFRRVESGTNVVGVHVKIPSGSTEVLIALTMLVVLILRPDGLTGGKEVTLSSLRRLRRLRRRATTGEGPAASSADRIA